MYMYISTYSVLQPVHSRIQDAADDDIYNVPSNVVSLECSK